MLTVFVTGTAKCGTIGWQVGVGNLTSASDKLKSEDLSWREEATAFASHIYSEGLEKDFQIMPSAAGRSPVQHIGQYSST